MTTPLNTLLDNVLNDISRGIFIEEDVVRVRLLRTQFEIWFEKPNPRIAADIRRSQGDKYAVSIRVRLINTTSGKDVRGFDRSYLHPWWMRRFVFDIAAAVAHIEREWDVMSPAFVEEMESQ